MNRHLSLLALLLVAVLSSPVVAQLDFMAADSMEWDLQEETDRIAAEVAGIRGLTILQPVVAEQQTKDALSAHIREGLRRQMGEDGGRYFVDALVHLGALTGRVDLAETVINLASSQAAAHYDPGADKFFLLMTNMPLALLSITAAHELCHALQDQHFDLSNFMEGNLDVLRNNQDALAAKQFLVEGDATHVMTTWMVRNTSGSTNPATVSFITSSMLRVQANLGYEAMCKLGAEQAQVSGMDFLTDSLKDIESLPRIFVEPLFEAYFQGAALVDAVLAEGGWSAVDALYKDPPLSSEQVLHPEKLKEPRDNPVVVSLAGELTSLGSSWVERERDVLGELGIRVFLKVWLSRTILDGHGANKAAAGWGGDLYMLLQNEQSHATTLLWKTLWDSDQDANEFSLNWRMTLTERFPNLKAIAQRPGENTLPTQTWEVSPGRYIQLARKGLFVGVLDTSDASLPSTFEWK